MQYPMVAPTAWVVKGSENGERVTEGVGERDRRPRSMSDSNQVVTEE